MLIRPVTPRDRELLAPLEEAADAVLTDLLRPDRWLPAESGEARAAQPGFILVAEVNGIVVGFVHVLEIDGAHLEQLSVHPSHARRGLGRALVIAAQAEAGRRGHERITLRTFRDVAFNAPFYATVGFVESAPSTEFERSLVEVETRLGLDRYGPRIQMTAPTDHPA